MKFFLQQQEITIYRLQAIAGTDKKILSTLTIAPAHIQQLSEEALAVMPQGAIGKSFKLWTEVDTNILDGDEIKDENGVAYKVAALGVNKRDFGICQHKEIIIERKKS